MATLNVFDSFKYDEKATSILKKVVEMCKKEKAAGELLVPLTSPVERAALLTGVSESTLYRLQRHDFVTPEPTPRKCHPNTELDDFDKDVVKRTLGDLVRSQNIIPTLADIRKALQERIDYKGSRESLRKLLHGLGFRWKSTQTNRSLLMERSDVVVARIQYLRQIRTYREEGHPIVYTDETFVHSTHAPKRIWQSDEFAVNVPFSKGTRHIIVHAGSEAGFVQGAGLVFKSQSRSGDYHDEMNSSNFMKWLESSLIPNLPPRSVLVVDQAPYHKIQEDKCPTTANNKSQIKAWLDRNKIQYGDKMLKVELLHLCKINRPSPKYVIDIVLEQHGHRCLRLPPYHAELNPIEMIWAQIKGSF